MSERKEVARGRNIVLRREAFDLIVELVQSRPLNEAAHLLPFITDSDDTRLLPKGGEVLDLADVIERIDIERATTAPKEETPEEREAARMAKVREAAGATT